MQEMQQKNIRQVPPPNINVFSPEYANYIGQKPRAATSATVRLNTFNRLRR